MAVAYVVVAGGVIQLASAVFPAWEMPTWALRLVIILLLIGFPIALILAWAFDVTPEGIRTTPTPAVGAAPAAKCDRISAVGVIVSVVAGFFLLPRASARKIDKSIAVLPFENFSDDKENAFFADGIQDDILTNLAKIGDLKVISRTSVMPYRGKEKNVREIGKALGVSAILEGSVRKSGNRVRVNVQLINAINDEHIWAEDYDRDLTDVFAIQTDLAQKIAHELQAKLSPTEKAQMTRKPTENGEAYLAFVQAHNLHAHLEDFEKLKQAEQLYERAIQTGPELRARRRGFLPAGKLDLLILLSQHPRARRRRVRWPSVRCTCSPTCRKGISPSAGSFYYGRPRLRERAEGIRHRRNGTCRTTRRCIWRSVRFKRRQGKWTESNANLEKAASLSPNDPWPLQNLIFNYEMQRDFDAANKTIDRALKLSPESLSLWSIKAQLEIAEKGTFETAERGLQLLSASPMPKIETRPAAGRDRPNMHLATQVCRALRAAESLGRRWPPKLRVCAQNTR